MEQQSIKKATELIIDAIQNSDINLVDKYELLLNVNHFLQNYEQETKQKTLSKTLKIGGDD